jgi:DNA-binding SARP family transcriptional activator
VRLGILGPLLVVDDAGVEVPMAVRQRTLLAALLVHANRTVAVEQLAEAVWDGQPPDGAVRTLRTYMVRLRQAVGPGIAARIETRAPGYMVRVGSDELDVLEFERLCRIAGAALRSGGWVQAADAAEWALGLWRGEPLLDVPSQLLRDNAVPYLEQLRVAALEDRAEARMQLGWHEQLVPELQELAREHPLRERFHAQLMLALYRCGRQAEALTAYQQTRRVLVEQLGIEPGPRLRRLQERILSGDETGLTASAPADQPWAGAPRPRQLPAAAGHFTGRHGELEWLTGLPDHSDTAIGGGGTVVISAIDGMAGIGKTALAVHAAHRVAARFPGGQLFADLHGYTKGQPPRTPGEALDAFLRALGVPAAQIPEDTEARATLYRQRLADTNTLIVLDNALDEAQVRPLLPGAPGCLVLITSRRKLKGLDDARSLSLDLLPPADAVALLRAVAGPDRIAADDPLLGEITELCGRLPLALRIAGALLRHRPVWNLGHLAELLRDQRRRVHVLSDGERNLATVFGLSYTGLDKQHRLLFRSLGLVPGPDADAYAAAILLERDPNSVAELLEDLVDHNLLIAYAPSRYRLHDLIRAHARTLADQDAAEDNQATLNRLLHYYAHTAQRASIPIARYPRPPPDDPAPAYSPALSGPEAARGWLRAERDNLEAASAHARTHALDGHIVALAAGLAEILRIDGPLAGALDLHQAAADAAEGHSQPAARATALADLATVRRLTGDYTGAAAAATQALEIYRATGHRHGEANTLTELASIRQVTGDLPGAGEALSQALEIYHAIGNRHGEAVALTELGRVRHLTGDLPGAAAAATQALEIYRATGHRRGEANTFAGLGRVRQATGDLPGAGEAHAKALEIYRATGSRSNEAWALNFCAATVAAGGDMPRALALYQQALAMNRELNKPDDEAIGLEGIGECHLAAGEGKPAIAHLKQALEIYRRLGMALDTERVSARLAGLATG